MKLTPHELARRLDLPDSTLERWIRQGRIPVQRVENSCVFDERELTTWAASHGVVYRADEERGSAGADAVAVSLAGAMREGGAHRLPEVDTVSAALAAIAEHSPVSDDAARHTLVERLLEREGLSSTGIGGGVAVPHPRSPQSDLVDHAVVVTGFLPRPITFNAVDGQPVDVLFLLLAPSVRIHLAILSRLAFCLKDRDFAAVLADQPDTDRLLEALERVQRPLPDAVRD